MAASFRVLMDDDLMPLAPGCRKKSLTAIARDDWSAWQIFFVFMDFRQHIELCCPDWSVGKIRQ